MNLLRKRSFIIAALLVFSFLVYLLLPINTDDTRQQPDPVLLAGKQAYLAETRPSGIATTPNIIVLFADDLGKYDISLYGGKDVPTPNIDALAASGVTFTDGYVTAPICSPSRAGLLTGRYQQRFGHELQPGDMYPKNRLEILVGNTLTLLPGDIPMLRGTWRVNHRASYPTPAAQEVQGLQQSEITFADLAKAQGYATGMVGKWHLGHAPGFLPQDRGFDYHYGFYSAATLYAPASAKGMINRPYSDITGTFLYSIQGQTGHASIRRNDDVIQENGYLTERIAEEANAFIEQNREKPFMLYVPFNAPHTPFQVPALYYDRFSAVKDENKRVYYAMISALDDAVGAITRKVRDAGLEEKTLILFSSDNGGATYTHATTNAPLKGGKLSLFEGGINVPFAMSWKGRLSAGTVYKEPVSTLDVLTTIAANIGAPLPKDRPYDGVDLVEKVIEGKPAHEALYWRSGSAKAVRKDNWKLVISEKSDKLWLYDLATDKSESTDLSNENPAVVAELQAALEAWEQQLIAPLWPSPAYSELHFGNDRYIFDI
ncbi:MAG: Arylsulfatase [Candidatus Hydrogenedentota bacterium]